MLFRELRQMYLVNTIAFVVMMWVEAYQQVPALLFDLTTVCAVVCLYGLLWLCEHE